MTVDATPFVVEKLSASVSGVHARVCARSAQPVHRSSTVSPRTRTTSAPPPRPRVTSFPNASAARANSGSAWPRTSGGRGRGWLAKPLTLRGLPLTSDPLEHPRVHKQVAEGLDRQQVGLAKQPIRLHQHRQLAPVAAFAAGVLVRDPAEMHHA